MLRQVLLLALVGVALAQELPRPSITVPSVKRTPKIIQGTNANEGQFPYIVSLNYVSSKSHSCGGSILTPSWILTAGHCCLTGSQEYIYTSSIYLSRGGMEFQIARTIVHPDYDANNYWHNDICLVQIQGSIPLGPNAQLVTLPSEGLSVPDKSPVVIPGWGYTTSQAPQQIPDRLQVVTNYFARSPATCSSMTGVPSFQGHICAISDNNQGVCQGDSGGPLTYNGVQVGITSFVFLPCASTGYPDYFTRVANYISWIQQNIGADAKYLKIVDSF